MSYMQTNIKKKSAKVCNVRKLFMVIIFITKFI